jgi:hypothetical protein
MEGVIEEDEEIFFTIELNLFTFETITLPKPKKISVAIFSVEVDIEDLMFNFPHF